LQAAYNLVQAETLKLGLMNRGIQFLIAQVSTKYKLPKGTDIDLTTGECRMKPEPPPKVRTLKSV